jgi:hypothetical protein
LVWLCEKADRQKMQKNARVVICFMVQFFGF